MTRHAGHATVGQHEAAPGDVLESTERASAGAGREARKCDVVRVAAEAEPRVAREAAGGVAVSDAGSRSPQTE